MTDLAAARWLMGLSLAFHILFAAVGVAMPLLMVLAEWRWLRTRQAVWLELCRRQAKGVAILFAVGAVSGTVLSFELGLLWPRFMQQVGPVIGLPFAMEGFAFFLEAICLGLYLYGWGRLPGRLHLLAGVGVWLAGSASAVFVVAANGWMNQPTGFRLDHGRFVDIDPLAAMCNPMWWPQALHMLLAALAAVGFGAAGLHALLLLRRPDSDLHRRALAVALWVGGVAAVLLPPAGDLLAKRVAALQPVKLAAIEGLFQSSARAPLTLGGWPDQQAATTRGGIAIPGLLGWLAFGDADARVQGLDQVPREQWPPVAATHLSFQVMVGIGALLLLVALIAGGSALWRRQQPWRPWFLRLLVACAPLGFVAVEAGWLVTEFGRQPWIVQGILRTRDAVTPAPGQLLPLLAFTAVYLLLFAVVVRLLRRQVFAAEAPHA